MVVVSLARLPSARRRCRRGCGTCPCERQIPASMLCQDGLPRQSRLEKTRGDDDALPLRRTRIAQVYAGHRGRVLDIEADVFLVSSVDVPLFQGRRWTRVGISQREHRCPMRCCLECLLERVVARVGIA